jgi:glucuronate isomerase
MFTTSPTLAQLIERMIDETPIVDPHTHIRCDRPSAPDLASLMSYHWVQTELRAVGMPPEDLDPGLPGEERVRRSIPYLRRMRNTAMAWCLYRILRDLYDFHEPNLTEANYRALCDKVERTGNDPAWAGTVLRDRCHVETFVTSLGNRGSGGSPLAADAFYMLDAHYLFCPGVATDLEPFFVGRTTRGEYGDALASLHDGERPATSRQLARLLRDWLDATVTGRVRFSNTFIPIEQRFLPPDEARVEPALRRLAGGRELSDTDIDALVRFVTWEVLGWHHDQRKAFQIAVGAEYFICDGKSIPRFQETWTSEMARAFHAFPGARFDLMMASDVLSHEAAVLIRQFPNVYASGYWWHNFFPATIERIAGLRLQVAPMTKFSGFLCDAYYVEWTYGKLQVVRKALAASIAKLVEAGYYEEDEVPPILRQILHDTPRDLYDLGSREPAPAGDCPMV